MISLLLLLACPTPDDKKDDSTNTTKQDSDSDSSTSENQAPGTVEIAITPADPGDTDDLTLTIVSPSVDPDGDTVSYTMAWTLDGAAQADLTGETVPADRTQPMETWAVTVTPNDGTVDGPSATAQVTIHGNQAPVPPQIHIDPATPVAGDALDLIFDAQASDPDGDTLTQDVTWALEGTQIPTLDGKLTVPGKQVKGGATWTATVSVSDGVNPAVEVSASVTVMNQAPVIDSVTFSPTAPSDGTDFSCLVSAYDPDGDRLSTTYRWLKDGVEVSSLTSDTVPNAETTVGEVWTCEGTVSDGFLEATDSASVTIAEATKVRYQRTVTATLTPDGNGGWSYATGTATFMLKTSGVIYGTEDCQAVWSFVGTPKTKICRGCDYDFTVAATYDPNSSALNTPHCAGLGIDGTGELNYSGYGTKNTSGNFSLNEPAVKLYYYSSYYGPITPYMSLGENYNGGYSGYSRNYVSTSSVDTYGYLQLYSSNYLYLMR